VSIKSFSSIIILFLLFLCVGGCAGPEIKISGSEPDLIKQHKSFVVNARRPGMHNTGIQVTKGDYISIIAQGEIRFHPNYSSGPDWHLMIRIGEKELSQRYFQRNHSFPVSETGTIYLGYGISPNLMNPNGLPIDPKRYSKHTGQYGIDIIVWQKEDPVRIADFLERASLSNPNNKTLKNLALDFKGKKEIILAEQKAQKEVGEAQKAILALKGEKVSEVQEAKKEEPVSETSEKKLQAEAKQAIEDVKKKEAIGIKDAEKEKQMVELTEKLQKASQSLKELEEMKKKLAEQQEKEKQLMARLEQAEMEKNLAEQQEKGKQLETQLKMEEMEKNFAEQQKKEKELAARLEQVKTEKIKQTLTPPVIAIGTPKDGVSIDSEYINLFGVVEHDKSIEQFEIRVNQQLVGMKDQKKTKALSTESKRIDFTERVRLREGKNEISIFAQDKDGLMTKKTISIQRIKKQEEVWAVVIGIDKYKNFPSLKYSANDARGFYRYLIEGNQVPKDHIWLLLDEEANLNKMRSVLGTQLRQKAGKDDMVIVYLAGHGATEKDAASPDGDGLEKYILPHDADPKDFYASAMPMGEVARIFSRISSGRLVFISDTCYSGATGGRTVPVMGMRANVSGAFWDRLSQGTGRVIITASDANEVSMEKDDLKHGVFTFYLLEALQGKGDFDGDGVITVDEVYRYVSTKVPQATNQEQHPVKKGEMKGQIVLGIVQQN